MASGSQKRVRFALTPPSSPSSSSASFSSPPGPTTPPPLFPPSGSPIIVRPTEYLPGPQYYPPHPQYYMAQPQYYVPWPQYHVQVPPPRRQSLPRSARPPPAPESGGTIDPVLAASRRAEPPPLIWDLAAHPNDIELGSLRRHGVRSLWEEDLQRCAVDTGAKDSRTPLRRMVLLFAGIPHLEIEIRPTLDPTWSHSQLPYVSVGDVIYNLYRGLRASIEPEEFEWRDVQEKEALRVAYGVRLERTPNREAYIREAKHGVRKIDYLGERRVFLGLRAAQPHEVPPGRARAEVFVVETARAWSR